MTDTPLTENPLNDMTLTGQIRAVIKMAQDRGYHLASNWMVNMSGKTFYKPLPRVDSTASQLRDVIVEAIKIGCYDAAEVIEKLLKHMEGK